VTIASGGTGANSVSFGPRVYSDCGALQPENHSHTSARLPELRLDAEHTLSIHWSHRRSQPHGSRVSTLFVTLSLHEHIQALPRVRSDRIEILYVPLPDGRLPSSRCIRSVPTPRRDTRIHSDASDTVPRHALQHEQVQGIYRCRAKLDQDLVLRGRGCWHLCELEHVWRSVLCAYNRFHRVFFEIASASSPCI
jgi:hypothetical protein